MRKLRISSEVFDHHWEEAALALKVVFHGECPGAPYSAPHPQFFCGHDSMPEQMPVQAPEQEMVCVYVNLT